MYVYRHHRGVHIDDALHRMIDEIYLAQALGAGHLINVTFLIKILTIGAHITKFQQKPRKQIE